MRLRGSIWTLAALGTAIACGGTVSTSTGSGPGAAGEGAGGVVATGGSGATGAYGATGGSGALGGSGAYGGTGGTVYDAGPDRYVEPECPDAAPPPQIRECEPFENPTGCGPGEGCYPFVDYPTEPCEQKRYGTYCAYAGTGTQGDACGQGTFCAANHVCVISDLGTHCVQMCPLEGDDGCPEGLICGYVDVEGIGGCI